MSDPEHAYYGRHLSAEEVHDFIRPTQVTHNAVHDWLYRYGILDRDITYTAAKDWIKVRMTIAQVEKLLSTTYCEYVSDDGQWAVRTSEWSLPHYLHKHVSTVQPTNSFFAPQAQAVSERRMAEAMIEPDEAASYQRTSSDDTVVTAVCNTTWVTPLCLRTLYGTVNYTAQSAHKNKMALNNFLGEVNLRTDAELYLREFRPDAVVAARQFTQISVNGGTVQQIPLDAAQLEDKVGVEGNLDAQTMMGIGWPTPLEVYSTGGSPPYVPDLTTPTNTNEPYLAWLDYILSLPDPLPAVISTSYGCDEQTVPKDYAVQVCNAFAQLGARGVTVLFASGDSGVGPVGTCSSNDGTNRTTFLPNFPSTCPYVTSVGGTSHFNPEVPVFRQRLSGLYTGGGGFSDYFERPSYQDKAVSAYVTNALVGDYAYPGLFNPRGRAYPDISGQSLNYTVYWNGTLRPVSGTSAATPAVAAVLALVNDALIAAGRPTLGFLNPFLYAYGHRAFSDVRDGSNHGCGTQGFPAVRGWDAATGWGTPNFQDILILKSLGWGGWHERM